MDENVSVILPTRNEEKYIAQCLDSIMAQDYPMAKVEILVVDGMSTDGTRKILAEYAVKYRRMKIIDNPERIVPRALNIGIRHTQGEYIMRVDAHTIYATDYISSCIRWLRKTNAENIGGVITTKGEGYIGKANAAALSSPFGE